MAKRLVIHGQVQGVGFRASMWQEAQRRGVTGWVRNRSDGCVEAVVDGAPEAVAAIVAWAQRGPPAAEVTAVDVTPEDGRFSAFECRPTA